MTDWFIRPTTPGAPRDHRAENHANPTMRSLNERRIRIRGGRFMVDISDPFDAEEIPMHVPMNAGLCEHKQNAANCLQCFHLKGTRPKGAPPPAKVETVIPSSNPVIAAVRAANTTASQGPVYMGTREDGAPAQAPEQPPSAPVRGKMPVPVVGRQGAAAGQQGAPQRREAFDYANDQGRHDSHGVWHPAKHESLIDRIPGYEDVANRK